MILPPASGTKRTGRALTIRPQLGFFSHALAPVGKLTFFSRSTPRATGLLEPQVARFLPPFRVAHRGAGRRRKRVPDSRRPATRPTRAVAGVFMGDAEAPLGEDEAKTRPREEGRTEGGGGGGERSSDAVLSRPPPEPASAPGMPPANCNGQQHRPGFTSGSPQNRGPAAVGRQTHARSKTATNLGALRVFLTEQGGGMIRVAAPPFAREQAALSSLPGHCGPANGRTTLTKCYEARAATAPAAKPTAATKATFFMAQFCLRAPPADRPRASVAPARRCTVCRAQWTS